VSAQKTDREAAKGRNKRSQTMQGENKYKATLSALTFAILLAVVTPASIVVGQSSATNAVKGASGNAQTTAPADAAIKTVTIGSQVWMAENLNVDKFRNGDPIPEIRSNDAWGKAYRETSAAWSYYDNDPANGSKYGKLYNWYAVNDPRGLAPKGWHVPTDKEWQTLMAALGGQDAAFDKMKSPSGFCALPGGERYYEDCSFYKLGEIAFWWSSTKEDTYNAWYHAMHFGYSQIARDNGGMNTGFSVRCVKDVPAGGRTIIHNKSKEGKQK
jgi:uncharacterized protein (TIGR02145 family)